VFRPRIIPVLLLQGNVLAKSVKFKQHRYIGDPINAVRIFNELCADELVFLDINATRENRTISLETIRIIAEEAMMPFSVGGGVSSLAQIKDLVNSGVEKVIIGTYAIRNPDFIRDASREFGTSTISVCIDVKKNWFGKDLVWYLNGNRSSSYTPLEFAQLMQYNGAGEVILQSIERDGTMQGYNIELLKNVAKNLCIPTVGLGGAASLDDMESAYLQANLAGLAAGSLFVYHGSQKGVLINYPAKKRIRMI